MELDDVRFAIRRRNAINEAIRMREFARIRAAYEKAPDSAAEADDWRNCEEFEA